MLNSLWKQVHKINELYKDLKLTNSVVAEFSNHTIELKLAILKALVLKFYKFELHDEQLLTVLALQNSYITEVKTGEGKSICIALSAILNRSVNKHTYVVTTNSYLAKRDCDTFRCLIEYLGYTCEFNKSIDTLTEWEHKEGIHIQDIVYTDTSEICFDYLRSLTEYYNYMSFDAVIIDEIDYVLSDNATSMCTVSNGDGQLDYKYIFFMHMFYSIIDDITYTKIPKNEDKAYHLWDVDTVIVEQSREAILTESGISHISNIINSDISEDNDIQYIISKCCEAYFCYTETVDYLIEDDKVWAVNPNNGRVNIGSSYEIDIQNAIEMKHGLTPSMPRGDEETISYQAFFSKFKTLQGLSGTLMDAKEEFKELFNVIAIEIPTHKPVIRKDIPTKYFRNRNEKYRYLTHLMNKYVNLEAPTLIICQDEQELKLVSDTLTKSSIIHTCLTNITREQEDEILELAGRPKQITVSTSILGRGSDIKLDERIAHIGLTVILMCHFNNRRIDLQAKGRSGRQGQPGMTFTLSSLEDKVWQSLKLSELTKLSSLQQDAFYSKKQQLKLNDVRVDLQFKSYSRQFFIRRYDFAISNIIDTFKQRVINLSEDTIGDIDAILNHKYSFDSELFDSEVMLLQIDDYKDGTMIIDKSRINEYSKRVIYLFYKDALNNMLHYSRNTFLRSGMETYLPKLFTYCNDYYMYTTKRFLFQFLSRGEDNE